MPSPTRAAILAVAAVSASSALGFVARAAVRRSPVSWATYGFDLQRTGFNRDERAVRASNASHLHKLWSKNLGGVMVAQPVEAAGVRIHGEFAFNAANGKILWHSKGIHNHVHGASSIVNGTLFVPTWDHHLYAFGL